MIEFVMDGRRVQGRNGEYLLAVARRHGIRIPTLCHHDAVEPAGACRLCMVEITKPSWRGSSKLVTSCLYPVEAELVVKTGSERVKRCRQEVLELLLARSPQVALIRELADEYGIGEPKYRQEKVGDKCILCDICTRVCQTLVTGAISRVNRGIEKKVSTPFAEVSEVCVGCLACARSCPTGAIEFNEDAGTRTIWNRTFERLACPTCGRPTMTKEQAAWTAGKEGVLEEELAMCDACKVARTAVTFGRVL
jgi:NADH dehydrogenase/NADH:ubiquinone oxidoreductase subunit G